MRRICCVCLKIKSEHGGWEKAGNVKGDELSHGYCPRCYRRLVDTLPADIFAERYRSVAH
ncbi:MAG: hypothetical protein COZ12_02605 [Deltaproteobacteria bacterium CG_4_10_14_3_um_filter_60_8]|nr:MAG: hypothetical protein COX17_08825 [Deltaproteobacteria bacterium CG23_combo_of_CG06-09_8_20_14_all_60_8]PIY22803.1 MAG: hypothetical protein COZ12_02605 [Deltaproteobacteria bacterium CG_4_10_14_3_um_filter_60_8]